MKRTTGKVYLRRGVAWWISYRARGKEYRESVTRALGLPPNTATKADAEALLHSRLEEVYAHRLIEPSRRRVTMGELLDTLLLDYQVRQVKSIRRFTYTINNLKKQIGAVQAQSLTPADMLAFVKMWQDRGLAPAYIRDHLVILGQAMRLGVLYKRLREAPALPKIAVRNARQGFIEPEQFEAIALGCPHVYQQVVRFAWLTGWRQGEILGLTWEQIHKDRSEARIPDSKNGDARVLPIGGALRGLIDARWKDRQLGCKWVFHRHGKSLQPTLLRRLFRAAAVKAGYPGLIFHDLRRSAVRNMERAGVLRTVAMRISGHRSEAIFRRYAIVSTEDVSKALAQTEAYVSRRAR